MVHHTFKVRRTDDIGNIVGYTLNMYLTNNTLLLNGKDIDQFMNVHLPVLHEIMVMSVQQIHSVPMLNSILVEMMQQLLDQRSSMVNSNDKQERNANELDDQCDIDLNHSLQDGHLSQASGGDVETHFIYQQQNSIDPSQLKNWGAPEP